MRQGRRAYVCQQCGYRSVKWMGRCPDCGGWETMVLEQGDAAWQVAPQGLPPRPIGEVELEEAPRVSTGLGEVDRVLGGGLVPGSAVLLGGDPGIGKSTLLLQVLEWLARRGQVALYVSGEESPQQVKLRAQRLGVAAPSLYVMGENALEEILRQVESLRPGVVVVDSIQTVFSRDLGSAPGSVSQVRECASRLVTLAKRLNASLFLVGHVTKEGLIAGPRVLEHLVDTVLYLEGDRGHSHRLLRAVKNRFGSVNEVGVFRMEATGLVEVDNPSAFFLAERPRGVPGSAVVCCLEGNRPLLVELQALVSAGALGSPRRTAMGVDPWRASLLLAVLEKRMGFALGSRDVFLNVAGGLRVVEPAVDLGIVSAVASSYLDRPLDPELAVFGEVGLVGEVRGVAQPGVRLREAQRMGFRRCVVPRSNLPSRPPEGMRVTGVASLGELFAHLFPARP